MATKKKVNVEPITDNSVSGGDGVQTQKEFLNQIDLQKLVDIEKNKTLINKEFIEIGISELNIKKRKDALEAFIDNLKVDEQKILTEINSRYGEINVSLETGEFTRMN